MVQAALLVCVCVCARACVCVCVCVCVCGERERASSGGAGGEEIQRQFCQRRTKKETEDKRRPEGEVEKETWI